MNNQKPKQEMTAFENPIGLEWLRTRLRMMNDTELLRYGRSARYRCSPEANFGKPPREGSVVLFDEARAEWKRRHPELPPSDSI